MEGYWVVASPRMTGKQPYWPDNLMKRYIRLRHGAQGKWGRRKDRTGDLEAREQQDHARRVYTGRELA